MMRAVFWFLVFGLGYHPNSVFAVPRTSVPFPNGTNNNPNPASIMKGPPTPPAIAACQESDASSNFKCLVERQIQKCSMPEGRCEMKISSDSNGVNPSSRGSPRLPMPPPNPEGRSK